MSSTSGPAKIRSVSADRRCEERLTDQLVKTALQANVSHITIHGRTRHQASTEPVSLEGIKFAVEAANGEVPCVANGDLWDLGNAKKMREVTGVRGIMGARGLLAKFAVLQDRVFKD